jgi:hypothetical protein
MCVNTKTSVKITIFPVLSTTPSGSKYPMSAAHKREEGGFVGGFVEGLWAILEDGVYGVEYSIKSSQGIDMEVEVEIL